MTTTNKTAIETRTVSLHTKLNRIRVNVNSVEKLQTSTEPIDKGRYIIFMPTKKLGISGLS